MQKEKTITNFIISIFFLVCLFLFVGKCQASTGTISLNFPGSIVAGEKFTLPLGLTIDSGTLGGWTIDIIMDPRLCNYPW